MWDNNAADMFFKDMIMAPLIAMKSREGEHFPRTLDRCIRDQIGEGVTSNMVKCEPGAIRGMREGEQHEPQRAQEGRKAAENRTISEPDKYRARSGADTPDEPWGGERASPRVTPQSVPQRDDAGKRHKNIGGGRREAMHDASCRRPGICQQRSLMRGQHVGTRPPNMSRVACAGGGVRRGDRSSMEGAETGAASNCPMCSVLVIAAPSARGWSAPSVDGWGRQRRL